jgi:high affinity choline transporter 7
MIVAPVGGGGLLAGIAVAARALAPDIDLVGVQSEAYPSMAYELAGRDEPVPGTATLADGIAVSHAGALTSAILLSAVVTTAYTVIGGMWSVAYTDIFQLALVALGLAVALPFVLDAAGGLQHAWTLYSAARPDGTGVIPPFGADRAMWTASSIAGWWDVALMLIFGGIPWNCYFQRVLSCRTPRDAKRQSILAGVLTIAFTVPPLLMGIAAFAYPWPADIVSRLQATPADAMPLLFARAVPRAIGLLGLAAIIGAVTSSFSSSILSAGSMLSWNCLKRLVWPSLTTVQMKRVIRSSILLFGAMATVLALKVQSVQALWFFTSDLVFVLLFPQLLFALFDPRANRTGSIVAFTVSLVLRVGGGEPLLGLPAFIPYPDSVPFRTLAAVAGMVLLPLVSRATLRLDPPSTLRNVVAAEP